MDSYYQADHCDDNATVEVSTRKLIFAVLISFVIALLIHLAYRLHHASASDNGHMCTAPAASGTASSRHEPEDHCQLVDPVSVEYGLDSVLFDVWQATLLPMLSVADIFQLSGTSRRLREMLLNEYTFKRICQKRYHLSPCLEMSYIRAARILFIADSVASLHHSPWVFVNHVLVGSPNCRVFEHKHKLLRQLSSLALMAPPTAGQITSWTFSCLQSELVKVDFLSVDEACEILPNVSRKLFGPDSSDSDEGMNTDAYRIEDLVSLLQEKCGSIEENQEALIEHLQSDISTLESYLPYVYRSRRLVDIAKCFYSIAKHDKSVLTSLAKACGHCFEQFMIASITPVWTYNPFVHWDFVGEISDHERVPVVGTRQWIDAVIQLTIKHSVLKHIIMGSIRTVHAEDYFMAVLEYEVFLKGLPESSIPDRETLYHYLGSYLEPASQESHSRKEWTAEELFKAMVEHGKVLAKKRLEAAS
ncbi:uncharacterized protein LOC135824954 [Sycon ciliatum]|uniref:uncharacterized protein LOC135824954 n=1 Tax=Sycon ciliatum TaxID=27933 RepID=UPI0031F71524